MRAIQANGIGAVEERWMAEAGESGPSSSNKPEIAAQRSAILRRVGELKASDLRAMAIVTRCATNVENLMSEDQMKLADQLLVRFGL